MNKEETEYPIMATLDRYMRCRRLRSSSWQVQALEGAATHEDGHGDVALQPGPAAGRKPADDNFHDQGGREYAPLP